MKQLSQHRQRHVSATLLLMLAAVPIVSLADAGDMKRDARVSVLADAEAAEDGKKRRKEKKHHKEKHQSNHKAADTLTLAETKVTSSAL